MFKENAALVREEKVYIYKSLVSFCSNSLNLKVITQEISTHGSTYI